MLIKKLCTCNFICGQIWLNVLMDDCYLKATLQISLKKHQWRAWEYHKLTNSAQITVCISSLLFEGRARERSSSWDPLFLFIPVIHTCKSLLQMVLCFFLQWILYTCFQKKPKKKKRPLQIQQNSVI